MRLNTTELPKSFFPEYLGILGIEPGEPDLTGLTRLLSAHLAIIPFENISKLYYLKKYNLKEIPGPDLYLEGIQHNHFGGTCYSNNYYFFRLLNYLGYHVSLCGADMSEPEVHTVILVNIEGREFLVDVGYGAPLTPPISLDLTTDHIVSSGNDTFVLKPRDHRKYWPMEHYRKGELIHGYAFKNQPRDFSHFQGAVKDSFSPNSEFMKNIRIIKCLPHYSLTINNLSVIKSYPRSTEITKCANIEELAAVAEKHFKIPKDITLWVAEDIIFPGRRL